MTDKMNKTRNNRDFRTATQGWRVVRMELFLDSPILEEHLEHFPLAGWLVDDAGIEPVYWVNGDGCGYEPHYESAAGDCGWAHVVVGPNEELPTLDELNQRFNGSLWRELARA